jgi:hypothetical protein
MTTGAPRHFIQNTGHLASKPRGSKRQRTNEEDDEERTTRWWNLYGLQRGEQQMGA